MAGWFEQNSPPGSQTSYASQLTPQAQARMRTSGPIATPYTAPGAGMPPPSGTVAVPYSPRGTGMQAPAPDPTKLPMAPGRTSFEGGGGFLDPNDPRIQGPGGLTSQLGPADPYGIVNQSLGSTEAQNRYRESLGLPPTPPPDWQWNAQNPVYQRAQQQQAYPTLTPGAQPGRVGIPGQPNPNIQVDRTAPGGQPGGQPQNFGNLSDPSAWMGLVGNDAQLDAWVRQGLGPNADQGLIDYYKQKIKGQPGANPTEQAGSANYWMQKLQADPKAHGTNGGYPLSNPNDLTAGFTTQFGGVGNVEDTPGYKFALEQGLQGIDRGAASKGTLLTMGNQKDRASFASGLAQQTYGDEWNRAHQSYMDAFNIFNTNQNNLFGRNFSLAQLGLGAAGGQAGAAQNIGNNQATAYTDQGNARGAGGIATGNNNAGIWNTIGDIGTIAARAWL